MSELKTKITNKNLIVLTIYKQCKTLDFQNLSRLRNQEDIEEQDVHQRDFYKD